MRHCWKTILCVVLTCSLVLAGSLTAFASDAGAESDISMEDLLSLLSALTGGDSETEDGEVEEEFADYTLNNITFSAPASWTQEESEDENSLTLMSASFSPIVTALYSPLGEEEIDIFDDATVSELTESMGDGAVINKVEYVTVAGYPALWLEVFLDESGLTAESYTLVIQMDDAVFVLSVTGFGSDYAGTFARLVESISIDGSSEDTVISAAFDGVYTEPVSSGLAALFGESAEDEADDTEYAWDADGDIDPAGPPQAQTINAEEFDEIVLVDNEVCTVSITDISTDDDWYAMTASIYTENKSDINLYFAFDDVSINGYMLNPYWGTSVASGHKSNSEIHFFTEDFEENGIENVREMEFTLHVRDDDDWFADYLVEESFILYPFGEDVPEQAPQEFDDDAIVIVDNDDCTMIITGFKDDDDWYFAANLYLENKTDKNLEYSIAGSTAVNGYEMNPYFYSTITPGKKMNTNVHWYKSDLEANNIESVEELELDITIKEANDWFADPLFTTKTTIDVE